MGAQHTFTIFDSASDGLCCGYGEGMWSITENGRLLASGAEYGASETVSFVVPSQDGSTSPPVTDCEDTTDTIYVDASAGNQNCDWLSTNLDRYGYLCQFVDVASVCPGTCEFCDLFD